ncbi:ferritin-like domain-containing protein [Nocardia sp. NPDC127579]|uniref:ferritin-like domain-containing protein n=1 Tax=Nocardia sp. NPDC127579 TaxID=3345402 RepID=UPI00363548A8
MTTAEQQSLLDALEAEYAAVYAYGVVAAYANADRARLVSECVGAHRARRDSTIDVLKVSGVAVPAPDPAYTTPFPVDDPIPAANLAVTVENDCAIAWRAVVERTDTADIRRTGIDALTESAVRQATWRAILGTVPPTTAFPGKPV